MQGADICFRCNSIKLSWRSGAFWSPGDILAHSQQKTAPTRTGAEQLFCFSVKKSFNPERAS